MSDDLRAFDPESPWMKAAKRVADARAAGVNTAPAGPSEPEDRAALARAAEMVALAGDVGAAQAAALYGQAVNLWDADPQGERPPAPRPDEDPTLYLARLRVWCPEPAESKGRESQPDADPMLSTPAGRKAARQAKAMLVVQEHPDWPDAEIARQVGCNASTLSRDETFQRAAALARAGGPARPGFKTTAGDVDGVTLDPDPQDPAD